nr:MAG TPA: hypothetical protein [Caudoviricetes sp.]
MITVEFNSFEDMLVFAKKVCGQVGTDQEPKQESPATTTVPVPVQQATTPVQSTPMTVPIQTQAAPSVPAQSTAPTQQPAQVQTTAQSYTMDDLTKAAVMLMDSGRQADLLTLLAQFGVDALPALPLEQYGAFATALRGLGAQI